MIEKVEIEESCDSLNLYINSEWVASWSHNDESHEEFFLKLFDRLDIDIYYSEAY